MPNWLIKCFIQRGISWLPRSHWWNGQFQQYVSRTVGLSGGRFEERVSFAREHYKNLVELNPGAARDFRVLELGTGWYPIVPIGLYLCGAADIWTYDIAGHLSTARMAEMLRCFDGCANSGELQKLLPEIVSERLERLLRMNQGFLKKGPQEFLERLNIHVRVQDAQHTSLAPRSIDLSFSTGVLMCVPRSSLLSILKELHRVGRPGSVTSHYLNLMDHYSHFDRSITPYNFLKFSEREWRWLNNPFTWLNRLRISDYRELFAQAGFQIRHERNQSGSPRDLAKIKLAAEFAGYRPEDILVLKSMLAATCLQG